MYLIVLTIVLRTKMGFLCLKRVRIRLGLSFGVIRVYLGVFRVHLGVFRIHLGVLFCPSVSLLLTLNVTQFIMIRMGNIWLHLHLFLTLLSKHGIHFQYQYQHVSMLKQYIMLLSDLALYDVYYLLMSLFNAM